MSIEAMLDRPIAYHRAFAKFAGVTGAVLLSQAVYWAKRAKGADGWFYKTQAEWEEETGLTRREQETARRRLTKAGVLEEVRRGVPARLHYRVNYDAIRAEIERHSSMAESAKLACTEAPGQYGGKRQSNTETTTETTTTPPLSPPVGGKEKRATRLPEDWHLPKAWGEWAMANVGMTEAQVRHEADQFRDYWHATPGARARKLDWLATWRTWCRRWAESRLTNRAPDRRNVSVDEDLDRRGFRDLENDQRIAEWRRNNRPAPPRQSENHLPGMFTEPAQEERPLPERDVRDGSDPVSLLALRECRELVA